MFSCSDRHTKIMHDEYACPLCEALDDVAFLRTQLGEPYAPENLRSHANLARRTEEGCC